jgi:site-specific DNA-methyltransferase (adenine-specific)
VTAPEPYFTDGQVTLYLGDCREVLPALGLEADLVLADPPYESTSLEWDRWPDGWLEVAAKASRSLWCFGSLRMYLEQSGQFAAAGWKLSQDVIWEKHNGSGFATDRFKRVHEQATHWYRGAWGSVYHEVPLVPHTSGHAPGEIRNRAADLTPHTGSIGRGAYSYGPDRLARSVTYARSMHGKALHPTEKPAGILSPLIEYGCPPGGLVIDPFAGSGSTLDAARNLGRRAVGIEADGQYAEKAARRLSQATLFGEAAG